MNKLKENDPLYPNKQSRLTPAEIELLKSKNLFIKSIEYNPASQPDLVRSLVDTLLKVAPEAPYAVCSTIEELLKKYDDPIKGRILYKCADILAVLVLTEEKNNKEELSRLATTSGVITQPLLAHEIKIEDSPANVLLRLMAMYAGDKDEDVALAGIYKKKFCGIHGKVCVNGIERILFISPYYDDESPLCFATVSPDTSSGMASLWQLGRQIFGGIFIKDTVKIGSPCFTVGKFSGKASFGDFVDPPMPQHPSTDRLSYNGFVDLVHRTLSSPEEMRKVDSLRAALLTGYASAKAEVPVPRKTHAFLGTLET